MNYFKAISGGIQIQISADPDWFNTVAIEAAHRLSTVTFTTNWVVDTVSDGISEYLVEKNNYDALATQVIEAFILSKDFKQCQVFAKYFE